ncbi:MAG: hypothetical protein KKF27_21370 [Gammaproteobacteria bacterium]|nr:hypothetical protein [Gammaproteobacteria bacterium]
MIDIRDLEGAFSGPAWLVGNGPSLAQFPLDFLDTTYSFATGRIARIFSDTTWRPLFYIAVSTDVVRPGVIQDDIYEAMRQADLSFVCDEWLARIRCVGDFVPIKCKHGSPDARLEDFDDTWFSRHPDRWVSKFGSSMFVALQLAPWMGFNPLYLIGFDLDYKPAGSGNHFVPGYTINPDEWDAEGENEAQQRTHQVAYSCLFGMGVEVYNCTNGGELDVYPRRDWRELLP